MSKQTLTALFTEKIHKQGEEALRGMGLKIKKLNKAPGSKELIKELKEAQILCARSRTQVSKEVILNSNLDCIGAFCIGVNQIDIEAAGLKGIPVFNAPYGNTRSVAEMVIGLLIGLSRSLFYHFQNMHQGRWKKFTEGCFELRGKTLGIIGYGHIGSQTGIMAEALGMKVIYYDIAAKLPIGNAKASHSLKNLLQNSDFAALHVPETPLTKKMIGEKELSFMKKSSYLINTSRGSVVDLAALKKALESGRLAGAALDVFPKEPKSSDEPFKIPLQGMDKVILTPHIAGSTEEAQLSIAKEVCQSLKDFLQTGSSQNSVNFPRLSPPPIPEKAVRLSNIHKNQPGVLSRINKLASEAGANIQAQYLATNSRIGYLIMDLETKKAAGISQKIACLDSSIKTRIIS